MDTAVVGGCRLTSLRDVTDDLTVLDAPGHGRWAVVLPFDAPPVCARFDVFFPVSPATPNATWRVPAGGWISSVDRDGFAKGVRAVREAIRNGDVYQVNLCRRLTAPLPPGFDVLGLADALARGNPAPHAAAVRVRSAGVEVASASPELFLRRRGDVVESRPIKGTAAPGGAFLAKDRAENVMIVDLMRNDLGRVCRYGSVEVPDLCREEQHPGLAHLVSTVRGRLRPDVGWVELLQATFPPGSVTGAPKLAALDVIRRLEPVPRGVYCGAVGWVDTDSLAGDLNVAIRTFWVEDGLLHLGTGGGITWDSTPEGEWEETELKARRLLAVAAGAVVTIVWIDGGLLDEAEARVSPFDHGLLTGDGVFETLRVARGRPFAARRHLERLARSAAGMGLPCPPPPVVLTAMEDVIGANGLDEGRLRVTLTGGPSPLGSDRGPAGPTLIVAGGALPAWPATTDVAIAPWPRNERGALAGIKSTSYGENVVALAYALARGAGEAIFANLAGNLCEGTGSNVFVGIGGRLVTPPLTAGCLAGVTRDLILELVDVVENDLPVDALASADEAFLTSSTRDVQPIRAVDGQPLADCSGGLTAEASEAFKALLADDLDP